MTPTSSVSAHGLEQALRKKSGRRRANDARWFFKTGVGEYGHGDRFLGVPVPNIRKTARRFRDMTMPQTNSALQSPWHEVRMAALCVLVWQFEHGNQKARERIYKLYLRSIKTRVNNWDLVDTSAAQIVGGFLRFMTTKQRMDVLTNLARAHNLWERRVSVLTTFAFIRQARFAEVLHVARILRADEHDLIQKAVGWMLREVGNRNRPTEEIFLKKYCKTMPRTMLRYAIEKFPRTLYKRYLKR